jgi:3-dehydroquinate synthase
LLNLGHTFAHAIEQVTAYQSYLHGEAVAIGLVAAARLSLHLGNIAASDLTRIEHAIATHALPVRLREPLAVATLMEAMQHDKKARAGQLRFVVLQGLGKAVTRSDMAPRLVETVWREVGAA